MSYETAAVHLAALASMSWKLPTQEQHEVQSMESTRRRVGHLDWISAQQESRLFDLYRKYVKGERA